MPTVLRQQGPVSNFGFIDGLWQKMNLLKMARPGFVAAKSASASRLVLILPVKGQKVKGIGPSPFEVLIGSREEEPAGSTDRTAIAASFGHDVDARL